MSFVEGGEAPYTYLWSTGSTNQSLQNVAAGSYILTVTDYESNTVVDTFIVLQPNLLTVELFPEIYEGGVNLSEYQGEDGSISAQIGGGTPPYSYLWSTGSQGDAVEGLQAGTYTVTITDMNECTKTASVTLTEPGQLTISSITSVDVGSGYNVSCRTMEEWDGSIDLTVSGGVPPYQYEWNDGPITEDRTNIKYGTYDVRVIDANDAEVEGSITLTAPEAIVITLTSPEYSNGYNVSCYDCYNGSITTSVTGGVSPYSFSWSDSGTSQNRQNMNTGAYELVLVDDNSCEKVKVISLSGPEREDWTMSGNTGTDPSVNYIGTQDSIDFVFRTNNNEALRITSNGSLKIGSYSGQAGLISVDEDGVVVPPLPCTQSTTGSWNTSGYSLWTCPQFQVGIGTNNPEHLLHVKKQESLQLNLNQRMIKLHLVWTTVDLM